MSFATKVHTAWYVPVPDDRARATELEAIYRRFADPSITKVAQNPEVRLPVLRRYGISIDGPLFDTMIAHFLIQPEMRHSMDVLAGNYLVTRRFPSRRSSARREGVTHARGAAGGDLVNTRRKMPMRPLQLEKIFSPKLDKTNTREALRRS